MGYKTWRDEFDETKGKSQQMLKVGYFVRNMA